MHHVVLADIGVPMIFVQWPLMFGGAKANIQSTLRGVPLAWAMMLGVEIATTLPIGLAAQAFHWHGESPLFGAFYVLTMSWTMPIPWAVALAHCYQ